MMINDPYQVYIAGRILPITPGAIETKIKNKNKVETLISGQELNLIYPPGLTEYNFEFIVPGEEYPSAQYVDPGGIFDMLENLKTSKETCEFIVIRSLHNLPDSIVEEVTVEDYTIQEDYKHGLDSVVKITLKQYLPIKTQEYQVTSGESNKANVMMAPPSSKANDNTTDKEG